MQKRVYGHLPPKTATSQPWQHVCIDLIALNSIKAKDGTILDLMCLTMIDPATSWLKVCVSHYPSAHLLCIIMEVSLDYTSRPCEISMA